MPNPLKELFLLNPEIIFLNHGSFGACPRPVFERYQEWQRQLEAQPVEFLGRRADTLLADARQQLGSYLNAPADDLVFFPNPTTAINMVARNLARRLQPGDEILATNHEYGALDRTWRYVCQQAGVRYINHPIPLPVSDRQALVERFWQGVTPRTRAIFISHISSPTALIFPVQEICQRAREAGLLTIVDGAHAVSQLSLDLPNLGADIYTGACHKWLCAPKGSAFLYVRPEQQSWLDPLVISWGYQSDHPGPSQFIDYHQWQGTRDLSAFLSVPAAIEFQRQQRWEAVRDRCHHLAVSLRREIEALTGLPSLCPESARWFGQMFACRLPADINPQTLKERLLQEFRIEVPITSWNGENLLRVSIQGYNDQADAQALVAALHQLLKS